MQYTSREVYEYVSKKTDDKIVEWKTCRVSGQAFPIYQTDLDFYNKISPTFEATKEIGDKLIAKFPNHYSRTDDNKLRVQIPTPTLCPEERQRRRLMFRNERKLYKRKCDFTGKDIISIYSPDKLYKVYDQSVRWGDKGEMANQGLSSAVFDLGFCDSFSNLMSQVPCFSLLAIDENNGYYTNHTYKLKDSYMCFSSLESTHCLYSWGVISSTDCSDCTFIEESSHCYSCVKSKLCHEVSYSQNCINCSHSSYLYDCVGCHHCYKCSGLRNREYCIDNIQYSKDDYYIAMGKVVSGVHDHSYRSFTQEQCDGCFGDQLIGCKNCVFVSGITDSSDIRYTHEDINLHNAYDCYGGSGGQYCLEVMSCPHSYGVGFMVYGNNNANSWYCNKTYDSSYCFGCVGLRNQEYCIFNKQYTKEERHNMVPQVIAGMIEEGVRGEFFDPSLSPFGYNETVAHEYYPLTKDEALKLGYKRSDYEAPFPQVEKIIPGKKLPILGCADIQEKKPSFLVDILRYAIRCEVSQRPFKLVKQEIDFYIKHNLPLPTKHPDIRHQERMKLRPGRTLYLRTCDKCGEEMLSVYPKDSTSSAEGQQKVYCEKCYQQEVFG